MTKQQQSSNLVCQPAGFTQLSVNVVLYRFEQRHTQPRPSRGDGDGSH